ncbi:MAG: protease modulator HflC [Xanthomonadales bacterium]|nr:protease modulator HflC [Gammaproteobacteria bacterium]MBT8054370.1 protease modulator HflC [Gammaproteobacteria bacterium]NND56466.1 protease modulator HflC [Xanthomonadales bacterium]NNK51161.1 protease modulator HflC [Xanthomonadales bacterium]
MRPVLLILIVILGVLGVSSLFIVTETEYAIKFQLGRIVKTDYQPGIHIKLPFVNNVRKYDNRLLTLDTNAEQMLTSEQKFVAVDSFVKWHITDVARFYTSTQGNERVALNRLDSIVKDRIRNQIASRTLKEVISEQRVSTMQDITKAANQAAAEFGIEVVDVRIKAIELPDDVRESVFRRMAADRQKEANLYRFEGRESAERIRAEADRQAQVILAEAQRDGQTLRGEGDARSTEIYALAYGQDQEFYAFYRSLQAYGNAFGGSSDVMVIDPSSEFFEYFGSDLTVPK